MSTVARFSRKFPPFMDRVITAFPETFAWLGELVMRMEIDVEALQRPLRACDLRSCRATCCHDGVYLGPEESEVLQTLLDAERSAIEAEGVALPAQPIVYGAWRDVAAGPKTAVRADPKEGVAGYPAHFPRTACVFLLDDSRCALQSFAGSRGFDPWHYKPLTCWMHPLAIEGIEEDRPVLTLHHEDNDPQRFPDYDGFVCHTPCGRTVPGGDPAWRVLAAELRYLGRIGGRDLLGELERNAGL